MISGSAWLSSLIDQEEVERDIWPSDQVTSGVNVQSLHKIEFKRTDTRDVRRRMRKKEKE